MSGRREAVLVAAVQVVGGQGLRALTHRAVDQVAGVPPGTASNFFRSRRALVEAAAEAAAGQLEEALASGPAAAGSATTQDPVAAVAELLAGLLGPARTATVARQALLVEATCDPALAEAGEMLRAPMREWARQLMTRAGAEEPEQAGQLLAALLDGLLLQGLGEGVSDVRTSARAAVRAVQ